MKLEKEDKQYFIVGIIACFLIAAIVTFNVWMWRNPNHPENPDSSKKESRFDNRDSTIDWVPGTPYYHKSDITEFEVKEGLRQRGDSDWNYACELAEKRILSRGEKINPRGIKHYKH